MPLDLRPALAFDLATLAAAFTRGFEGYFVPIAESAERFAARLRHDSIDLALSSVALLDGQAAGIVLVAVRGWQCRIVAMGVAPEARRRGVGRRLMEAAIPRCRALGLRRMVLEVIEENEPAVALYRGLGFAPRRRLVGYQLPAHALDSTAQARRDAAALEPIDPREAGRRIAAEAEPDLPWQLAAETFGTHGPELSGVTLHGKALALSRDPDGGTVALETLLVPRADRRAGWGTRLIRALASRHRGQAWKVPARVPEGLAAPFFASLGFRRSPLTQREMALDL